MTGTLIAILSAVTVILLGVEASPSALSTTAAIGSPLILVTALLLRAFGLVSLQRAEKSSTPGVLSLAHEDGSLRWIQIALVALPFLSVILATQSLSHLTLGLWLVLTGGSIDMLLLYVRRIHHYIDPHSAIELISKLGIEDAKNGRDGDLAEKQVILCDIGYRALQTGSSRCALYAITGLGNLLEGFYEHSSLGADESKQMRLGYISAYGLDQLESLFRSAISARMDPTAIHVLTTLGGASVAAAEVSPQIASQLLHTMGELSIWALGETCDEVCVKGSLTLTETAKMLVSDPQAAQTDLSKPLLTAVGQLDDIAQQQYRKDNDSDLQVLTQPAQELKRAFSEDATLTSRKDVRVALQAIESLLSTFQNLQLVLNTVPPIPDVEAQATKESVPEPELPTDDEALQMYRDSLEDQD